MLIYAYRTENDQINLMKGKREKMFDAVICLICDVIYVIEIKTQITTFDVYYVI